MKIIYQNSRSSEDRKKTRKYFSDNTALFKNQEEWYYSWYKKGKLHRENNLPAHILYDSTHILYDSTGIMERYWYIYGQRREAYIEARLEYRNLQIVYCFISLILTIFISLVLIN